MSDWETVTSYYIILSYNESYKEKLQVGLQRAYNKRDVGYTTSMATTGGVANNSRGRMARWCSFLPILLSQQFPHTCQQ